MIEEKLYSRNMVEIQLRISLRNQGKRKMANRIANLSVQDIQCLNEYSFRKREQKKNRKSTLLRKQFQKDSRRIYEGYEISNQKTH